MIGFFITSGSGVDSVGGPFYVVPALSGKRWAENGVRVMSDRKSKNFSFRAVVFTSNKLVSVFATTMLLLLADGGINNSATAQSAGLALDPASLSVSATTLTAPAAQQNNTSSIQRTNSTGNSANASCASMDCVTGTPRTEPQPTKIKAVSNSSGTLPTNSANTNSGLIHFIVSLVIQTEYASNGNSNLTQAQITELYNVGMTPQQMYELTVMLGFADSNTFYAASCAVFWCSFAPPAPSQTTTVQQTSVQQDITSTGNSATQTPLPQSVCNMMINGQCNPNTVTAVTAVVATAVIGGITAGVVTAVNNQAQQQQQEQQQNNNLTTLLLLSQQNKPLVCYDSAQPPNVIPCP